MNTIEVLNLAQAELRAMYKRLGIKGSNVLDLVDDEHNRLKNTDNDDSDAEKAFLAARECLFFTEKNAVFVHKDYAHYKSQQKQS